MTGNSLCSIVVPTFNRPELAIETIVSIQAQSYANFEVILVDDGSSPDTLLSIHRAISTDNRFRLVHRDGAARYCGARRNQGFALSSGQYVLFFDSDDLLEANALERRIAVLEADRLDFVVSPATLFSETPGDLGDKRFVDAQPEGWEDDVCNFLSGRTAWQSAGPLYRRSFLEKLGLFDISIESAEDIDFHVRALLQRPNYRKLSDPDYWYRRNNLGSITGSSDRAEWFYAGIANLIRKLDVLINAEPEPLKSRFRRALWKRTVKATSGAKLGKLPAHVVGNLLQAYPSRTLPDRMRRLEVRIALAGWRVFFGKIPSLAYLNRRGWLEN